MATTRFAETVTADTVERARERIGAISSLHADALVVGCRIWAYTNAEGFEGDIIVWPDKKRAAMVSDAASHWGEWDPRNSTITLDNDDVYSDEGGVGEDA